MSAKLTAVRRTSVVLLAVSVLTGTATAHAARLTASSTEKVAKVTSTSETQIGTALKMVRNADGTVTVYER